MSPKLSLLILVIVLSGLPTYLNGITTIHHDKPEEARIEKMATKMKTNNNGSILLNSERQKRLLPYINYYQHRQQPNQQEKFTPFLDSNALPGPFLPMGKPQKINYYQDPPPQEPINYGSIYDKLAQLKLVQQIEPYHPPKQQIRYVPVRNYHQNNNQYKILQPSKTIIETYTPTNIDIPPQNINNENVVYKIYQNKPQIPQHEQQYITINVPHQQHHHQVEYNPQKIYQRPKQIVRKPILLYQPNSDEIQDRKPIVFPDAYKTDIKPHVTTIVDDSYVAQKFTPVLPPPKFVDVQLSPSPYNANYEPVEHYQTPSPSIAQPFVTTENSNTLSHILKQLQDSNTLPHTLTPENIDNSIKTLVKILNALKKQQKFSKPIIVPDELPHDDIHEDIDGVDPNQPNLIPGTVSESFPADTVEGGTPGRPGVDYPALSTIPQTTFNCKTQRYKGFFGDPDTNCQVWHYCDLNGGQASFLCPNGTIFSQVALTCDWWYNVKCSSTAQLYVLNERLYKYILPLSPKFPEDYSGPLVDKYLALKFKEMEEKMRKEKKDKPKKDDDDEELEKDDSDQLQDIQNENREKSSEET